MSISIPVIESKKFQPGSGSEISFTPPQSYIWHFEQRLWVEDPCAPGNAAHNYALPVRIRGSLNRAALERSVAELVRRQQVLRSAFTIADGSLLQKIVPMQPMTVPVIDLTEVPPEQKDGRATEILVQDSRRPFDLRVAPLLRVALLRLESQHHILLLTTHHIVCDNWSTGILLRELFTNYVAFSAGQPSPLPESSYEYSDYCNWLNSQFQGEERQARLNFWRSRLNTRNEYHHVTPDRSRFAPRSYRGTHQTLVLEDSLSGSLKMLSVRERVSPYMVLLAGLQCLLRKYSHDEQIGVGSCVANRGLPQVGNIIAPLANVMVLRSKFTGRTTFREVLRQVRQDSLIAYSYQDFPFGAVVQTLRPTPDPARNPLFQVLFVLLNAPNEMCSVPGLTIEPVPLDTGSARYELNLWVKYEDRVELDLQYNSDLFERASARIFLERYREMLWRMVDDLEAAVDGVPIPASPIPESQPARASAPQLQAIVSQNEIQGDLVSIWQELLKHERIGLDEDFFELGGDSLIAGQMFAHIEARFQQKIPLSTLVHASTISKLAQVIVESRTCPPVNYLVPIQLGAARPPLFCIHGKSGNVLMYRILAPYLGVEQSVYALQPRGIDGKQSPLTRIEEMATEYLREIRQIQPAGPFLIAGYCMGGTVAWELAQQLHRSGEKVALLALLDTYDWSQLRSHTSRAVELHLKAQLRWFSFAHFIDMSWRERHLALKRRLVSVSSTPYAETLSEANRQAATDYVPQPYDGRVLHVCMGEKYPKYKDARFELRRLAPQMEQITVPGFPWQLFKDPIIQQWATKLREKIDAAVAVTEIRSL
jgi:thioesterase domain-containing protein/acyl carrier protein